MTAELGMAMTQSQKHWRAWVRALQTRDAAVRAEALGQLTKFLDYWVAELYVPFHIRGITNGGHDTPQPESWDEVFNVDTEIFRSRRANIPAYVDTDEAWLGPYGLDEAAFQTNGIQRPLTMNPWDNLDGSKETRENLSRYYCEIQRLTIDCPFADVRRVCRKLLDKARRKRVEIPSLVNEGPSWLIPVTDIIGFKSSKHKEQISIPIPEKYMSDYSSSDDDSDIEFAPRRSSENNNGNGNGAETSGYSYYTSPDATPRPTFSTPAIPINAPPRSRTMPRKHQDISRNTSQESIVHSVTSSHKSTEHKFPRQPHTSAEIRDFQIMSFVSHGRITNYAKVLFFLPRYLRCSTTCYEKLIGSAKGLPRTTKMYVALLAAAEVGCQYFVSYFSAKIAEISGDLSWIRSVKNAPSRIQRITALNWKMVSEPWSLDVVDVWTLMDPRDDEDGETWTVAEVVQIIVVLAMFHAQSALALATGVVCEADVFGGTVWPRVTRDDDTDSDVLFSGTKKRAFHFSTMADAREEVMDKLRMKMVSGGRLSPDMSSDNLENLHHETKTNGHVRDPRMEALFHEILNEDRQFNVSTSHASPRSPQRPGSSHANEPVNPIIDDLTPFTALPTPTTAQIFPPSLLPQKFAWEDALHTLQQHLPDLAKNLDKRFHLPPTRNFLQPASPRDRLDAKPFKDALHAYSLALLGWFKDGYDYSSVTDFLDDELRKFVRRVVLGARGLTKEEWQAVRASGFEVAELVEICMMVCEARFMGVLMYACKVIGSLGS